MAVLNFKDWQLRSVEGPAAAQLDHKSRQIAVTGDIPEGYSWDLLVMAPSGAADVWSLAAVGDGLAVVVTRGMVPEEGRYAVQLRGTLQSDNDTQRHTNIVQLRVLPSITAGSKWPVLPTEFSQAEARLRDIAAHPPIPGNGVWQLWNSDTGAYEDSELPLPSDVDGVTPHIGDNDNWYLGDTDTGKPSRGRDGGWYTPSVTQPDEKTLRMAFTPSKDDMPDVAHTDIMLPGGGSGSVAVDSTLTVSGQAADAKVTGDSIRSLSDEKVDKDYIDLKKYGISAAEYEAPFTAEMYEVAYANGVGIQNAINDAKARGMERITLPAGNYPLCYHAAADEEYNAIIDASGIDFYGYGVKLYVIYDEEGTNPYFTGATPRLLQGTIISTDRDVCGFHFVGERRFRQGENTKFRDKSCGIALTSTTNGNTIKDCVVECISGDGIGAGVHMEQVGGWTPDTFTSIEWDYETGAYVESNYMYTSAEHTTDWLDLSRPLLVRCTGYFLYSARPLIIRCFDSDGTYIGVVQFWQGEYFYLPENTAKWRLELTRVVEHETTATETWSWWMGYGTFSGTKIINCESRLNQRGGMSNLPNDVLVKDCYIHNNGNAGDGMVQYYDTTRFGIDIEDIWIHRITIDGCRIVDNFNCLLFRCGSVVVKNSIITNVHAMNQVVDFHAEQSVFQEDITWIAPTPFGNKVAIGCTFGGAVPDSLSVIGAGGGLSEAEVTALIESYIDTGVEF